MYKGNAEKSSQGPLVEALSNDPSTEGFDMEAGRTWIYPTNYSLRDYQFSIIQQALFQNTMVSLPTGLGKTFIAAVIMYNFFRWYPKGKIIFMAPTRPLVKQQIDACYNIMAIPANVTAELTGTKTQALRKDVWCQKRVFFVTPQVLQNDLNILTELGTKIKCVVFDEAHKAKGNHAYCQVIKKLVPLNGYFRVLALSATPGSTLNDVLEVIDNLLISHLEIRTDESPDVTPYIFQRSLESIVVPLGGKLEQFRDEYLQILEKYTRVLVQYKVIHGNCSTLTKGKVFMTLKEYQKKNKDGRDQAYSEIMKNLTICITLYHAYDLLIRHGLRSFLSFFEDHADKPLLSRNQEIPEMMNQIREYLGPAPNIQPLPDGTIPEIPKTTKFGHPKFYKLLEILLEHFNNPANNSSKVIIFCEFRESVMEVYALLLQHQPLIRPKIFLGQSAISQRQQISIVRLFREGECNTLISTSIGEEGLDVGNVDLIICFDINNKSPVRMVQRMGRTGRKREGRVVILVTEGKEQQTLKECLIHKQNLTNHILQSSKLYQNMYKKNPRMIPDGIDPECQKVFITVKPNVTPQKKKNSKIKDMFQGENSKNINWQELDEINNTQRIPAKQENWNKGNPLDIENTINLDQIDFSKRLGKLRILQQVSEIGHSWRTKSLVSLLQFAESKKYDLDLSQVPVMGTQKPFAPIGLKQTDIRSMFAKISSSGSIELTPAEKDPVIIENILEDKQTLTALGVEIASYLTSDSENNNCKICESLFDCSQIKSTIQFDIMSISEPDVSILDRINIESFELFSKFLNSETNSFEAPELLPEVRTPTKPVNIYERTIINVTAALGIKNTPLRQPSNIENIFKKCGISPNMNDSLFDNVSFTQIETRNIPKVEHNLSMSVAKSFMDADFTPVKSKSKIAKDDITFFNVNSLDDIFADTSPQDMSQSTVIYSPPAIVELNNEMEQLEQDGNVSPILCSYDENSLSYKKRIQKKLLNSFTENSSTPRNDETAEDLFNSTLANENPIESTHGIVKEDSQTKLPKNINSSLIDVSDFAELSVFGFDCFESTTESLNTKLPVTSSIQDFVDTSLCDFFGDSPKEMEQLNMTDVGASIILQTNECEKTKCVTTFPKDIPESNLNGLEDYKVEKLYTKLTQKSNCTISAPESEQPKPLMDSIPSPDSSPIITDHFTQRNKICSIKAGFKLSTVRSVTDLKQDLKSSSPNLDESFQFTFHNKQTPKKRKLQLSSCSSSGSPILNVKPRSTVSLKSIVKPVFIDSSDSDDDFVIHNSTREVNIKPRPVLQCKNVDNFGKRLSTRNENKRSKRKTATVKKKWIDCEYLDVEAELELDQHATSDSLEDTDEDKFEESFVNDDDDTQNLANTTINHAQYLKSVRSPINRGMFKIPHLAPTTSNVYSQLIHDEDDSYVNDSFCVSSQEEVLSQEQVMSELEEAELVLAAQKGNFKRSRKKQPNSPKFKRRRIIDSDSN